jgi:hypothetical protein
MVETYLSRAGAIVLSGAALLGVAYGIAKYVADFEAAKAEIQSLRGQIVQLQELLTKAQSGWDVARIERLEKEVAELRGAAAMQPAPVLEEKSIADHLASGGFGGSASDGKSTWPFRASKLTMGDNAQFEAEIEWVNLDAVHRIRGNYSDKTLFFKEVEVIKAGNNVIGCEYTLDASRPGGMSGVYRNCEGDASGGTIVLEWR